MSQDEKVRNSIISWTNVLRNRRRQQSHDEKIEVTTEEESDEDYVDDEKNNEDEEESDETSDDDDECEGSDDDEDEEEDTKSNDDCENEDVLEEEEEKKGGDARFRIFIMKDAISIGDVNLCIMKNNHLFHSLRSPTSTSRIVSNDDVSSRNLSHRRHDSTVVATAATNACPFVRFFGWIRWNHVVMSMQSILIITALVMKK